MRDYIKLFIKNLFEPNEKGYTQIDTLIRRLKGVDKYNAIHDKQVLEYVITTDPSNMKVEFIIKEMLKSKDVVTLLLLQVCEVEAKVPCNRKE